MGLALLDYKGAGDTNGDNTDETFYIRARTDTVRTTISDAITETGYYSFSIQADTGYQLGLGTLTWDSARGGTSNERGFFLWADLSVGGAFIKLLEETTPNDTSTQTRDDPTQQSVILSAYGDVDSITFRYYALADATGKTMDAANYKLTGDVVSVAVPEPSSTALLGLGGLALILRRRR